MRNAVCDMKFMKSCGMRNNKGWIRIVEIVLSIILVFGYLMYLQQIQLAESDQPSRWSRVLLRSYGNDILNTIDAKDENANYLSDMKEYINNSNWASFGSDVSKMMPENTGYTLYLYDANNGNMVYKLGTSVQNIPQKKELVLVDHIVPKGGACTARMCTLHMVLWFK